MTLPFPAPASQSPPPHDVHPGDLKSLVVRTAAGDDEALAALFRRYGEAVHALAFRLSRSADDADDVVQDVFVGLPAALRRYEERGQFDAWLMRVTARTVLMRLRTARRDVTLPPDVPAPGGLEADRVEWRVSLERALGELSPGAREVVLRREIEGRTHAEIAADLGISRNSSEVRLFRALRQLRSFLGNSR